MTGLRKTQCPPPVVSPHTLEATSSKGWLLVGSGGSQESAQAAGAASRKLWDVSLTFGKPQVRACQLGTQPDQGPAGRPWSGRTRHLH